MSAITSFNERGRRNFMQVILRENRPAQIIICVVMGAAVGGVTGLLHIFVSFLHRFAFHLGPSEHLSAVAHIDTLLLFTVPVLGGLALSWFHREMKKIRPHEIADPIEANAIYGGRMSAADSLRLLVSTLISNGAGISVGMEAAYTQVGSCLMSKIGDALRLRRSDMRIFVAAGAAAAIAAAYNAPLAGAFYGYELILGSYAISSLPQVTLCALSAYMMQRILGGGTPIFSLPMGEMNLAAQHYTAFALVGVAASFIGILTMRAVTGCETLFRNLPMPEWLRPALGGLMVSAIAYFLSPLVLGSGQGGIDNLLHGERALAFLGILLAGKIAASALSIGSGFRGGLFSASLFLGCILGRIAGIVASNYMPVPEQVMDTFMLVGTGSVAAAVVGSPLTMVMLVLEMTGSFVAMTAVLAGVLISSTVTRYSFGYSFSTWRFHLKGAGISGARDVGWVRDLTVERLMIPAVPTAQWDAPLEKLRLHYSPAGGVRYLFLVDAKGNYRGVLSVALMHNIANAGEGLRLPANTLAKGADSFLLPKQNIQEALAAFAAAQLEEMPVIASAKSRKIIGYVRESQLLKRYSQDLETHNIIPAGM